MVTENFRKLYMAIGLQKWLYGPQVDGSILNQRLGVEPSDPNDGKPNGLGLADATYISWLEKHPSALTSFVPLMSETKGKQIVVFLDYDGTLSPIVSDPDRAFMSDPMRSAVREVARHFPTAIISGRSRGKVYDFVKLDEVYYAGSHGMDIMGPPLHVKSYDGKYQINTLDDKLLQELRERTCGIPGTLVEDNRFCISVHYRHVLDQDYGMLEDIIRDVVSEYPNIFHLTRGKKVLEIRPSIKWNKGDALVYLLDTLGFSDSTNVPFLPRRRQN
ncbi:UNVERIFIED_CONTAM: putative trehalose-phosphate phosphatase 3 [Sesamum radiatum]|uniref:Trehalose 6-phosphate phosphatase n=1 Tax=Sesamum radiatum TaxID=300843 RepID=A0AAW2JYV2_SESRA